MFNSRCAVSLWICCLDASHHEQTPFSPQLHPIIRTSVTALPLQVYRGRLPAQKVLPHPLLNEDASDTRLFQDAHLHFLRVPAHPPRPGPHPVPGSGQLPYAASTTDTPQLRLKKKKKQSAHNSHNCFYSLFTLFLCFSIFLFFSVC